MNRDEKKALLKFLVIYITSCALLVGFKLYFYYSMEIKTIKEQCSMLVSKTSTDLKNEILNAHMKNEVFNPSGFHNLESNYALYDINKRLIYSNIQFPDKIDFNKKLFTSNEVTYYISTLDEDDFEVKYIVIETCKSQEEISELRFYIILILLISIVFIGLVAYFLAMVLLKPARARIDAMDKFIKDSAHELNTPISVLMTSVSMLKNGKNPEKMMKYILSSSKQISQVYNDIHFSAFNDLNEDVNQKFDLKDLVNESIEFFQDISITKNIVINFELDDCIIEMDKTKTQKIINNLLSNAIKYSNKDSKIIVTLKDNILSVQDFGIGITIEDQKDIFNRFKRGNNTEGGFGIGLDIVKRICNNYKLKLDLKSELNKGSKFSVDFSNIIVKEKI